MKSHKITRYAAPIAFFAFICWIIYDADRGNDNIFIEIGRSLPHSDKLFHALLFGFLAYLINMATNLKRIKIGSFNLLLGSVVVLLFAVTEEITQIPFENRDFDLLDLLSDLIGIVGFSYLAIYRTRTRIRKKRITQSSS